MRGIDVIDEGGSLPVYYPVELTLSDWQRVINMCNAGGYRAIVAEIKQQLDPEDGGW